MQKLDRSGISGAQSESSLSLNFSSRDAIPAVLKGSDNWQRILNFSQQLHQIENLDQLLQFTVQEVRQELQADRVLIYRFSSESRGTVLAETLTNGYTPSLGEVLPVVIFGADQKQNYQQQIVTLDPATTALSPHQSQLLGKYQIQSSLSVPIVLGQVWGLLVVQHCSQPRQWLENDVTLLWKIATELRLVLQQWEFRRERESLFYVSDRVRRSATIEDIFQTITDEARKRLNLERVCIYKFRSDFFGDFIYESGNGEFPSLVGSAWEDTYLQQYQGGRFRNNAAMAVDDVETAGLADCHQQTLKYFGIRSFVVVAIKQGEKLWGLLSGFQHSGSRHWFESEVSLLTDLGRQLGAALQERAYLMQLEEEAAQRTKAAQASQSMIEIISKILQAQDLETIFRVTNQAVRSLLKCDRVAIYRIQADGQSELMVEATSKSVGSLQDAELTSLYPNSNRQIADPYRDRTNLVVKNIYTSGFSADEVEQLEDWQVKAYVMTPIFKQDKLWGLLGVYQTREPRSWSEVEVNLLSQVSGQLEMAMQRVDYVEQLAKTAERDHLVTKVVERIRQSLDLPQVFKTTARELRNALSADRVAIYQFMPGTNLNRGKIIAEDIKPGYISIFSVEIEDGCFSERHAAAYRNGKITAIADINQSGLNNCYTEMLSQFQAQANLVLPLFRGGELWGLFCIHQCSGPRDWQETEIEFAKQIALQLNTAIQQGEYIQQLQQISQQLADAAEREKAAKERLQQEVIQVLTTVRPALDGDLTVRAPVTDDEVGTIADVYNNTLSSLRQIVTQMQEASRQVASTSQTSEVTVANLAAQAQQQFQALSQAQSRVKTMVNSIEAVEMSAQQVEKAVQQTNQIVQTGDDAMDHTVEKILTIRETVTETDKRLKQLSESSRKISRVVSLISNFTTQTHLLALNASIEAARAGDYGRGFAVVADEVRSLARQSANAATEIEQLVQEIQMGTAEVSTILETGMQQVEEGTDLVTEARENLNAVVDATEQISHLVAEIKQATQEQAQQFQLVNQTMTEVADSANKTTEDSATLSLRFKDLLTMAQTLKTTSDQFKVK